MLVPSLRKIKLHYTATQLFFKLGALQKIAGRLARFYLNTGGSRSLSWSDRTPMTKIVQDIEQKVQKKVEDVVKATVKKALGTMASSIDFAVWQENDAEGNWCLRIGLELNNYYAMWVNWLPALRETRPEVYEAVRMAISCFANCMSHNTCITPALVYHYWFEPEMEEIEAQGEDDERKGWFETAREEKETFEKHIVQLSEEEIGPLALKLQARIKKLPKDALSEAERSWLNQMAEFIQTAARASAFARSDDTADRDCMDISYGFAIFWEPNGPNEEYWEEVLEAESQGLGYPYRQFTISSRSDLIRACRSVKQLVTAQRLLDQGSLWEKKNDKTTEQSETEGMLRAAHL